MSTTPCRNRVFQPKSMKELNKKLTRIARVVMHPKYRTISACVKLVQESLRLCGKPYVEMIAVMARYNPFAEKAGMQKIAEQPPSKKALTIAQVLSDLDFNIQLLGSEKYVLNKLRTLKLEDVARIKEAFIRNKAPQFMKYFFSHEPYGKQKLYRKKLMKASLERFARLIKVCGLLLQTKVYLFWKKLSTGQA